MASDFDGAFVNMQTLAGVSADEVEGLKKSVLGLAGETGKAPKELADALYFIRSAGLDGKVALGVVGIAAGAAVAAPDGTADGCAGVTAAFVAPQSASRSGSDHGSSAGGAV